MISQEVFKGCIKPLIIKLIKEEGKMYGYQITQRVKELSADNISITEGALYPALHKLVADGILHIEIQFVGNRERKYYMLSEIGEKSADSQIEKIRESILILAQIFNLKTMNYEFK